LVLINGAPASGKSTLASRYASEHPLTLALDIDCVRSMLGGWLDQPAEAGVLARRLALVMARAQLQSGHDVLVPQFLGRVDFVRDLERLSADVGARFVEVALVSNPHDAAQRFLQRSADSQRRSDRDAAALLERLGGPDALPRLYAQLLRVVAERPATRVITTANGDIGQAYGELVSHLDDETHPTPRTSP